MNRNGILAVVVVITAVVLIGIWMMRSGGSRPGGRQFDCIAPPPPPANFASTRNGDTVTGTWTAPVGGDAPTSYVIEAGGEPGLNNQGTFVVPAGQTTYSRVTPAGTYYVRVFARNACGTSPASNEIQVTVP